MKRLLLLLLLLLPLVGAAPKRPKKPYSIPKASNSIGLQGWINARRKTGGNTVYSPFHFARSSDTAHSEGYSAQALELERSAKASGFDLRLSTTSACLTVEADPKTLTKGSFDFTGKKEKVDVTSLAGEFRWFENSTFQALGWPIKGGDIEAILLLPKSPFWLPDIERNLGWGRLQKELSKLEPARVSIQMPHVNLGEKGACLALSPEGSGAPAAGDKSFRADRPFLVLVRDAKTGMFLFIARVADPR